MTDTSCCFRVDTISVSMVWGADKSLCLAADAKHVARSSDCSSCQTQQRPSQADTNYTGQDSGYKQSLLVVKQVIRLCRPAQLCCRRCTFENCLLAHTLDTSILAGKLDCCLIGFCARVGEECLVCKGAVFDQLLCKVDLHAAAHSFHLFQQISTGVVTCTPSCNHKMCLGFHQHPELDGKPFWAVTAQ